ncbi:hypothetical protein QBC35DRAFT_123445 [Podospora australis]|uniref:Secreted protein n=1 Tax=Podospora australis TaxID=1536484 RepID=A0AAN6X1Q3_9PEZI|nr:hypothetical protein QBC35DRAFT_123445 [Podospora australis]
MLLLLFWDSLFGAILSGRGRGKQPTGRWRRPREHLNPDPCSVARAKISLQCVAARRTNRAFWELESNCNIRFVVNGHDGKTPWPCLIDSLVLSSSTSKCLCSMAMRFMPRVCCFLISSIKLKK